MNLSILNEIAILSEIAKNFPFSIEDVREVYNLTNSYDATIKTCEAAAKLGYSNPISIFNLKKVNSKIELIPVITYLDERGYFREILKSSQLPKFGQWSISWMTHGTIKAWHIHRIQTDYWFVVSGIIKACLADLREEDFEFLFEQEKWALNKYPEVYEYILGDYQKPSVLVIPPGVAHGLKVLQGPAVLAYITSEEYNPGDEGRIPYNDLGYNWDKVVIK